MGWLRMPIKYVTMYLKMLSRVRAEQSLSRIHESAAAAGSMEESDMKSYMRSLRELSGMELKAKKISREERAMMASQMGISVE